MIRENDKEENSKILSRIVRSFYMNKYQHIDEDIKEITTELKTTLINKALKIFEENKIIYSDVDETINSEFWKEKDISSYEKVYENYIYKAISLFVIKHLKIERNPASLYNFIKDSHNILPNLRYFPSINLSRANLSGALLLNISDIKYFQVDHSTSFSNSLTDDEDLIDFLRKTISLEKLPILAKSKDEIIKELKNREYSFEKIEELVKQSKFG